MTFSAFYLLPALAVAIVLQGTWIKGKANFQYRSRKFRRRVQARAIFLRFLVAALLLATFLTTMAPILTLSPFTQGALITAALMAPVLLYLLYRELSAMLSGRRVSSENHARTDGTQSSGDDAAGDDAASKASTERSIETPGKSGSQSGNEVADRLPTESADSAIDTPSMKISVDGELETKSATVRFPTIPDRLQQSVPTPVNSQPETEASAEPLERESAQDSSPQPVQETTKEPQKQPVVEPASTDKAQKVTSLHSHAYSAESMLDQTLSMDEQMESLDDLVEYHDIGADELDVNAGGDSRPVEEQGNPLEKAIAIARDAMLEDPALAASSREQLPAKSRQQLMEMVVRLQSDKMKLQKLVIAQKSVIESEKQSHARTRIVVKDAISVMRHARHGQRVAEKIARRERTLRQSLESDNTKLRRALDNALSTVIDRKKEPEH